MPVSGFAASVPVPRRQWLATAAAAAAGVAVSAPRPAASAAPSHPEPGPRRGNPIAVSTYSFWRFRSLQVSRSRTASTAAEMGFDAVEILEMQMEQKEPRLSANAQTARRC